MSEFEVKQMIKDFDIDGDGRIDYVGKYNK